MKTNLTFAQLVARFQTEDDCKAFLAERRIISLVITQGDDICHPSNVFPS